MNHLLQIRSNVLYNKLRNNKESEDQYQKFHELIFLVDKPSYIQGDDSENKVILIRGVEELRFIVDQENIQALIDVLQLIADNDTTNG